MEKELEGAIKACAKSAAKAHDNATDAMKFTQAALNAANALTIVAEIEDIKRRQAEDAKDA